ncbi:FAD-binding domain-containing protein [Leucogyrophana mollusca]|uniref:FAD-binding domain-containing protein n=1 Tax=Leucogyrophana mollusca TaxID=85980 RepID=A0ACB8B5P9_9AGAM|nr:FAD-binding domain-containing protein [Leucogyrophana mollusca]
MGQGVVDDTINEITRKVTAPGTQVFTEGSSGYKDGVKHWLKSSYEPSAYVIQPGSAKDLSEIIKILAEKKTPFAVKCGGHIACPKFSSTDGIQIYLSRLTNKHYDSTSQTLTVGAGCLWDEVYGYMEQFKQNVVGGDHNKGVGIGGYLLGGGFSLKTNQFGLGIDNIVGMEVVLPSGLIVEAKADGQYADLFFALKGGGNNFGIVTQFTLNTHPQGKVYGGILVYNNPDEFPKVLAATTKFATESKDKKAAIETAIDYTLKEGTLKPTCAVNCYYDDTKPTTDPFSEFVTIVPHDGKLQEKEHLALTRKLQGIWYLSSSKQNDDSDSEMRDEVYGHGRWGSISVTKYNQALIDAVATEAKNSSEVLAANKGLTAHYNLWPFLPTIYDHSSGGAWPHDKGYPYTPLLVYYLWEEDADDKFWIKHMKDAIKRIHDVAIAQGCSKADAPIYCNITLEDTPVSDIYRGNLERLKSIRAMYDPGRVMDLAGGFKI